MDTVNVTVNNEMYCTLEDRSYEGFTLAECLRKRMETWKDEVAFESYETGQSCTFAAVMDDSHYFAVSLVETGFRRGDVIAVILPNLPEYSSIVFGIWEAGLVASPMNTLYTADELNYQFDICGIRAAVTCKEMLPKVQQIECIRKIIVVGECLDPNALKFQEMLQAGAMGESATTRPCINTRTETALMLFSSGTTGMPKAVMLSHENVAANAMQFSHPRVIPGIKRFDEGEIQERTIAVLPFFHAFGFQSVLTHSLLKGACITIMSEFDPATFLNAIRQHKPTFLCLVPSLFNLLLHDLITSQDLESLKTVIIGGAAISADSISMFTMKSDASVLVGYGLTETSPITHVCREPKTGSVGLPLPMTWVKVIDIRSKKSLGPNLIGEICVKGPQVMTGYFKNERATQSVVDEEGWLHTGDMGFYDDDNDFFIVDRIKDMIKVTGFQVSPTEIEKLLKRHPEVADAAVIGIPDAISGELPRAFVVPKISSNISVDEIQDFVKNRLASFKQLKGGIEFIFEVPRNQTGKILRKDLLRRYMNS